MLARNPSDTRALFGLAAEFEKNSDWHQVIHHLELYLQNTEDQGNAWGRLARAHQATGDLEAAGHAYRSGIRAARAHGHPSMASEFEAALAELPEEGK